MRRLVALIGIVLLLSVLGIAGRAAWLLYRHDQTATVQLEAAHASLVKEKDKLTLLEQERRALADDYDILKRRWVEADTQSQRVTEEVERLKGRLDTITRERTAVQEELAASTGRQQQLQQQLRALQDNIAQAAADRSALTARLTEVEHRSLSRAELEGLAQRWALQQDIALDASERLEEISRAYEQLAQGSAPTGSARQQAAITPQPQKRPDAEAARLRRLGDAYIAQQDYPQAAQCYEDSLTLIDDATTHAKLAFLYTRFLHDLKRARWHTAAEANRSHRNAALAALSNAPQATNIPRAHWRLVWDWLTQ